MWDLPLHMVTAGVRTERGGWHSLDIQASCWVLCLRYLSFALRSRYCFLHFADVRTEAGRLSDEVGVGGGGSGFGLSPPLLSLFLGGELVSCKERTQAWCSSSLVPMSP